MIKHREAITKVNPYGVETTDEGLRAALTLLLTEKKCSDIDPKSVNALRYVRDRVSVPRDMNIWSAKRFRQACEDTAAQVAKKNEENGVKIEKQILIQPGNRRD